MKTKIRRAVVYTILINCFLPLVAYAQKIYEGQIIDKATELPIPAATVTLSKKHISTSANDQGYFKLSVDSVTDDDVFIFTSIGYQTYKLPVKNYTPYPYIKMQPTNTTLNQVNIKAGKQKQVTLDKFLVTKTYYYRPRISGVMVANTRWIAKLFNAPTAGAKLLSVQLGREDFGELLIKTNKFARFNLCVMDVDSATGGPGNTIFTKEVNLQDNSHLVAIDLRENKINLPTANFFVAIQWLFIPYNEVISMSTSPKVAGKNKDGDQILDDTPIYFIDYQPFLSGYPQTHPVNFWVKSNDDSWRPRDVKPYINSAALSVTVLY